MSVPVNRAKVREARRLGRAIARDVLALSRDFTTVSIERTALRFMGVSGTGPGGVPIPNIIVDRLLERGVLGRGAAWWLGLLLARGADLGRATADIASGRLPAVGHTTPDEGRAARARATQMVRARARELADRRASRGAFRKGLAEPPRPWKYIIVATGNIYDDVTQAVSAAEAGADVIAVIRSTAQSLLDYVPEGATTEGYGGTYATQENFRIMRGALDDASRRLGRYVRLTNYSSGLCMPEIACLAAFEGLDVLLNDAMYGILFRDINMRRTFIDQYVSRLICAASGIVINTGEDNYLTTADAVEAAHTVLTSLFINEAFALEAGLDRSLMGLGHAFEIDPSRPDSLVVEIAQALLVRQVFSGAPVKYMPPTKHKTGDIFESHVLDAMFNLTSVVTGQSIHLLGMMTEAMHNPLLMDRFESIKNANYVFAAARGLGAELEVKKNGVMARRAAEVLSKALELLRHVAREGLPKAIEAGRFADVSRRPEGGKGGEGVVAKGEGYFNPVVELLEKKAGLARNGPSSVAGGGTPGSGPTTRAEPREGRRLTVTPWGFDQSFEAIRGFPRLRLSHPRPLTRTTSWFDGET
ncbi:MAG: D-lysine 5,6-aminomutase subunit alpha [Deltaproteobacteria bacterium]|nr:D-lysine 5,6-aminomutase subunit alpha [Deltaproteobacteria bacterium]